jgi:uncharacterized membrane protein
MNRDMQPFLPRGGFRGGFVERVGDAGGWPDALAWAIFAVLLTLLAITIVSVALDAYYRSRRGPKPFARALAAGLPGGAMAGGHAVSILGVRYARGEISRDEYLRVRDDLGGMPDEAPTEVVPPPERADEDKGTSSD